MSELNLSSGATAQLDSVASFQVEQILLHIEQLPQGKRIEISNEEAIEISSFTSAAGVPAFVVRERHTLDKTPGIGVVQSEDVYFALRPDVVERPALIHRDNLTRENEFVEKEEYDCIFVNRNHLAQKTAFGDFLPDVYDAQPHEFRQFSKLLHAAASQLRNNPAS